MGYRLSILEKEGWAYSPKIFENKNNPKLVKAFNILKGYFKARIVEDVGQEVRPYLKIKSGANKLLAKVRIYKNHISVLCPLGHLLDYRNLDKSFAGSMFEAEIAFRNKGDRFERLAQNCKGHGH